MEAVWVIVWLAAMLTAIVAVYQTVGVHLMVQYFPEGKRWWMLPAQLLAIAVFGVICAFHPF